jgi:hypothetical protein
MFHQFSECVALCKPSLRFPAAAARAVGICGVFALQASLLAQPQWEWARHGFGSGNFDHVYGLSVASDTRGNLYVGGRFNGVAMFSDANISVTSAGNSDAFLAKYDGGGALQWVRRFGGTGYDTVNGVACDGSGNIYLAGRYAGPVAFGSFTLTNFTAGFVAKLEAATGGVLWVQDAALEWFGVAVDTNSNAYLVGQPPNLQLAGTKLAGPIALAKYNSGGARQWYTNSLAPSLSTSGSGRAIALDAAGNPYITGTFRRVVEFGGTSLTNAAVANNNYDEIFVAKFNTAGVPQWAKRGGGEGNDQGLGIAVDGAGNAFVTGYCDNTTALNSGTSVQFDIGGFVFPGAVGGGLGNMFLAKFSSAGAGLWARKLGGISAGAGLLASPAGDFLATGYFRPPSFDFGGVSLIKDWTNEELFVVRYDTAGNALWGRRSSSSQAGVRHGIGTALAPGGAVYALGDFTGASPAEFDGTVFSSVGTRVSMYVGKLAEAAPAGPIIQGLTLLGGGVARLGVAGPGQSYVIEASSDLSAWLPVATNSVLNGFVDFTDGSLQGAQIRYYRLKTP